MPTCVSRAHSLGALESLGCEGCTVPFLCLGSRLLVEVPALGSETSLLKCGLTLEFQRTGRYKGQVIPNYRQSEGAYLSTFHSIA